MTANSVNVEPLYLLLEYREPEHEPNRLVEVMNEVANMLNQPC
ncbi:MAG TPA: hypothetical protein VFQ44_14615 [Streptosporangiaceae bacterium]|nr:hypothetical protein [Streptosporangiaceae bacterium]